MEGLAPPIFGASFAFLITSMIMAYFYVKDGSKHLWWWTFAFILSAIRMGITLIGVLVPEYALPSLVFVMVTMSGVLLLRGSFEFVGREFSPVWYLASGFVALWAIIAPLVSTSFLVTTVPIFLFRGTIDIITGFVLIRARTGVGSWVAGGAFFLWGLHRFDYPILRQVEWFAPWGFEISGELGMAVGLGMLALHYEKAQDGLVESERKFRSLFENALDGFIRTTQDGAILSANPALVEMLGYDSEAEMQTLNMGRDIYASADERERLQREHSADDFLDGVDVLWKRKDGRVRTMRLTTRRIRIGGADFFEGSVRDVTKERILQEQLEVSRRMESLGRLAGGVAHDFNNILTAILGGAEMAKFEVAAGKDPSEDLEAIELSALQAADLSKRLLAFSRHDVEESTPQRFDEAVSNAESMLKRLIPKTIALTVEKEAFDAWVLAEPGQLERVIVNLAVNADEAMPNGGELSIVSRCDGNEIVLLVRDTGIGMDPETTKQIFEPFFTTKNRSRGGGFGLATVFSIVGSMDGTIDVESEPGKGTTFYVRLPVSNVVPGPDDSSMELKRPHSGAAMVLLAEDEDIVRRNLTRTLEMEGYQVLAAADGDEAIALGMQFIDSIHLVIADVIMPGKTGPQVVRALREKREDLPFLYMSGHTAKALEHEGVSQENFMPKPFTPRQLLKRIAPPETD